MKFRTVLARMPEYHLQVSEDGTTWKTLVDQFDPSQYAKFATPEAARRGAADWKRIENPVDEFDLPDAPKAATITHIASVK